MIHRAAVLAFPDDQGEPQARLVLEQLTGPGRTAAWLMCNPSTATHLVGDPTAGRVVHHSGRAGCPRSLIGNVWSYRSPYPADLKAWLSGWHSRESDYLAMREANLDALVMISAQADIHVVAYGAGAWDIGCHDVTRALEAFSLNGSVPLYCLGVSTNGHPLHPLSRGKFAVRNDAELTIWRDPNPTRPWREVFSDLTETAHGWRA